MSNKIGIINYGIAGNIHSVKKAIEMAGGQVVIVKSPQEFDLVDKIVIPGVGSFKEGMQELKNDGLIEPLCNYKKPLLGICLGMQILSNVGYEFGKSKGLGLLSAEVKPILCDGKIPHMGFNKIRAVKASMLLAGIEEDEEFYFMHSYEMVNYTDVDALSTYHNHSFVSVVNRKNIYGVQFHPEKSRDAGIKLFQNFINIENKQ